MIGDITASSVGLDNSRNYIVGIQELYHKNKDVIPNEPIIAQI